MILDKILIGIGLALPIGPVSAEMIKRGLKNGFWASFNIRLGGAVGNTLCLIGAYFGLSKIAENKLLFSIIGLVGAALLIYMGVNTLLKVFKEIELNTKVSDSKSAFMSNSLILGFILAVANPMAILYWISISATGFDSAAGSLGIIAFAQNLFIIVGVLLWGGTLSLILEFGRRILTEKFLKGITLVSGLILIFYGIKYGYAGTQNFMTIFG